MKTFHINKCGNVNIPQKEWAFEKVEATDENQALEIFAELMSRTHGYDAGVIYSNFEAI